MKKTALILAAAFACMALTACEGKPSSDSTPSGSEPSGDSSITDPVSSVPESTSSDTVSPNEKTSALKNAVEFPSMVEVAESNLDIYYGIAASDLEEYSAYICATGVGPDEFGVFIAKDADAAARVEDALKKRVESQDKKYRDYPAAEEYVYKLDDCFVNVNGNVVSYAICADNLKAKELLG